MTAHGDTPGTGTAGRPGFLAALAVFGERRIAVMLGLGFASGMPFLLVFDTLSAWLRDDGLTLEVIGFFSLATLVYSFKFLWAPWVDRAAIPGLTAWLGHRRSWMLLCQLLVIVGLWLIAGSDPSSALGMMAALAVLVGFAGATQDIAIDAWRIEITEAERQGAMAAAYQWGYRIAMLVAGAVPLLLAQYYGWNFSYGLMAALMGIGIVAVLAAPREAAHTLRPLNIAAVTPQPWLEALEWLLRGILLAAGALLIGSGLAANAAALAWVLGLLTLDGVAAAVTGAWTSELRVLVQFGGVLAGFVILVLATLPVPGLRTRPGLFLFAALGDPLRDFFRRYGSNAGLILALICFYRLSDFVLNIMNPFYLDAGFTLVEVAEVRKLFGAVATIVGIFAGGLAVARLGLLRAMVVGSFASPVSNLTFIWLAARGNDLPALFVAIGIDNVMAGFAGTCLIAYMSSLTGRGFTATQYALFSSLYALPGRLIASQSGRVVEAAAANADAGGVFSMFTGMFANLPAAAYAEAPAKSGVSPVALGAGYVTFFVYSVLIGVAAVGLAWMLYRRQSAMPADSAGQPAPG